MTRSAFPLVVHLLVLREAKVLLLRRTGTGFMDGYYVPPGGHMEPGENPLEAARRECEEEVGLRVAQPRPLAVMPYITRGGQGVNFIFVSTEFSGEPVIAEPDRSDALLWAVPSKLPEPHAPWLNQALQVWRLGAREMSSGDWYVEVDSRPER